MHGRVHMYYFGEGSGGVELDVRIRARVTVADRCTWFVYAHLRTDRHNRNLINLGQGWRVSFMVGNEFFLTQPRAYTYRESLKVRRAWFFSIEFRSMPFFVQKLFQCFIFLSFFFLFCFFTLFFYFLLCTFIKAVDEPAS